MLRVTKIAAGATETALRLEGQITAEWVIELERVCRELLAQDLSVRLDFREVTFIDRRGARMLERLPHDRLNIVNCSTLIRELLETARPRAHQPDAEP